MFSPPRMCPQCKETATPTDGRCPRCGGDMPKTLREAYRWSGLGVFDLLPGVRRLPYAVRVSLSWLVAGGIVLLWLSWVLRWW